MPTDRTNLTRTSKWTWLCGQGQIFGQVGRADLAKWTANKGTKPVGRYKMPWLKCARAQRAQNKSWTACFHVKSHGNRSPLTWAAIPQGSELKQFIDFALQMNRNISGNSLHKNPLSSSSRRATDIPLQWLAFWKRSEMKRWNPSQKEALT